MKEEYKRVSCDLYDQLEIYATRKQQLAISYLDEGGVTKEETTTIQTLETKNKSEFLITHSGLRIRLDKVTSLVPVVK